MATRSIKWVPDTQQGSYAGFSWLTATILGAIEGTGREELGDGHQFITWCLGAECSSVSGILMALVTLPDPWHLVRGNIDYLGEARASEGSMLAFHSHSEPIASMAYTAP